MYKKRRTFRFRRKKELQTERESEVSNIYEPTQSSSSHRWTGESTQLRHKVQWYEWRGEKNKRNSMYGSSTDYATSCWFLRGAIANEMDFFFTLLWIFDGCLSANACERKWLCVLLFFPIFNVSARSACGCFVCAIAHSGHRAQTKNLI